MNMKRIMYMFDYARLRCLHRGEFSCLLALLSSLGYKELGLYLEGAFLPKNHSGTVRKEIITPADADWILAEAEKCGMTVLPITNVLCHMEHFLGQERYAHLRRTGSGAYERLLINYEHPEAVPFALDIIRSLADMFHTSAIHIGMDEFPLTKNEIPAIGKYISAVVKQMMAEGLKPAVWSDMFWIEQSLTAYLPRETVIFDWNYYGHRPESLRYFREEGFRQIIAAPSDNGWEGFTGCQRISGHLRARMDIPVETGEIEAFLQDAVNENADGGMITNWENTCGRTVWTALAPMARAGLWMQGKWDPGSSEETQVEMALFNRITPYTRIVQNLRRLQMHGMTKCYIGQPQKTLFQIEALLDITKKPAGYWADTIALYEEFLPDAERELDEWIPQNSTEKYARNAMKSVVADVRAFLALMEFSQSRTIYTQAAFNQFSDPKMYCTQLAKIETALNNVILAMKNARAVREEVITDTGLTRRDLQLQDKVISYLSALLAKLQEYQGDSRSIVSLPCFTDFLSSV